jgi:hypothetical protein
LETAIGVIERYLIAKKIPPLCLEQSVNWTNEEKQQIFALRQAISDRTTAERREKEEDKQKKQGQTAKQQDCLINE